MATGRKDLLRPEHPRSHDQKETEDMIHPSSLFIEHFSDSHEHKNDQISCMKQRKVVAINNTNTQTHKTGQTRRKKRDKNNNTRHKTGQKEMRPYSQTPETRMETICQIMVGGGHILPMSHLIPSPG